MILIGLPDSPYVRRVAVSLKMMDVPFEHQLISVFRGYDRFKAVNPVVKAPSLVCDDGTLLMDSTLILDYVEGLVAPEKRLMPREAKARQEALRITGLALAAADKGVSLVYEKQQRPEDKRHEPWMKRVVEQSHAALGELEKTVARANPWLQGDRLTAADVVTACTWRFSQYYNAEELPASRYPALAAYSARAEALPEFASTPLD